jgi:hypothetical protein
MKLHPVLILFTVVLFCTAHSLFADVNPKTNDSLLTPNESDKQSEARKKLQNGPLRTWVTSVETLWPRYRRESAYDWEGFWSNITQYNINVARSWKWNSGLEVQFGITLMDARGKIEKAYYFSPSGRSDAVGVSFGPTFCWTPFECCRLSPFIIITPHLLMAYPAFPRDGTSINFFGREGYGIALSLTHNYSIEVAQRWGHVSNADLGEGNPGWDGKGIFFSIRKVK